MSMHVGNPSKGGEVSFPTAAMPVGMAEKLEQVPVLVLRHPEGVRDSWHCMPSCWEWSIKL